MSVDLKTVRYVASLSRIALNDGDDIRMMGELNSILGFLDQLNEIDVSNIDSMGSVLPIAMKKRLDIVADGAIAEEIVANAPVSEENFFLVPKMME